MPDRNQNRRPSGRSWFRMARRIGASSRTARTVARSADTSASGNSSTRRASTVTSDKSRSRATSRRNAAFRLFDSTRTSRHPGTANFRGIAGEPPPDPMSMTVRSSARISATATRGSTTNRSTAKSLGGATGSEVRLIVRFHLARSPKYRAIWAAKASDADTPARAARRTICATNPGSGAVTGSGPRAPTHARRDDRDRSWRHAGHSSGLPDRRWTNRR